MTSRRQKQMKELLKEEWRAFVLEFARLLSFVLMLKISELLVEYLFHEALIFGRFPKSYLFDSGDGGLLAVLRCAAVFVFLA